MNAQPRHSRITRQLSALLEIHPSDELEAKPTGATADVAGHRSRRRDARDALNGFRVTERERQWRCGHAGADAARREEYELGLKVRFSLAGTQKHSPGKAYSDENQNDAERDTTDTARGSQRSRRQVRQHDVIHCRLLSTLTLQWPFQMRNRRKMLDVMELEKKGNQKGLTSRLRDYPIG